MTRTLVVLQLVGCLNAVFAYSNLHAENKNTTLHCEGKLTRVTNIDLGTNEAVFELEYFGMGAVTVGFLHSIAGVPEDHTLDLRLDPLTITGQEDLIVSGHRLNSHLSFAASRASGRFQLQLVLQEAKDSAPVADAMWSGTCVRHDPSRNKF